MIPAFGIRKQDVQDVQDVKAQGTPQASRSRPFPPLTSPTILLVEDQKGQRDLIRQTLREHNFVVLFAADGETGLRLCQQHVGTIDLLIADVVMPGMSGLHMAEQIRVQRPNIRVLFISGLIPEPTVRAKVSKLDRFLSKPFSQEQLVQTVQDVLAEPGR